MGVGRLESHGQAAGVAHRTCAFLVTEKTVVRKTRSLEMHHIAHPVHRPLARAEEQAAVAVPQGQVAL
jgi:hypothetical protein